jgi:hypothetical protein
MLRGKRPRLATIARPAVLAGAYVGSHVAMDRLPLPYDNMPLRSASRSEAIFSQAWNAVVDMAVYGSIAAMLFERGANGDSANAQGS